MIHQISNGNELFPHDADFLDVSVFSILMERNKNKFPNEFQISKVSLNQFINEKKIVLYMNFALKNFVIFTHLAELSAILNI